jgi:uncharacterized protein (DUF697 family)
MTTTKNDSVQENFLQNIRRKLQEEVLEIEARDDLSDDDKVSQIINVFGVFCAGIAVQPIPFGDIFVITPIQAFMGSRIAAIRGMPISEATATTLLKELSGVVGLGMLAQQVVLGLYKVGLPFLGGFMSIPLVYGLTYGIGRVMDEYCRRKVRGQKISDKELRDIFNQARTKGKREAKSRKAEIAAAGKGIHD